jgi:predicted unusual protein kinase regulating ubiquinone biosynthesis (AarF/ABC1/UbiB family)
MTQSICKYPDTFHFLSRREVREVTVPRHSRVNGSLEERAVSLRGLLQDSGPLGIGFALYLSSRIDVLPAEYCRALELTLDSAPALSPPEVERIAVADLGADLGRLFHQFDLIPFRPGAMVQSHSAELMNGAAVTVLVLRPEYADVRNTNQIPGQHWQKALHELTGGICIQDLLDDYRASILRATDFNLRGQAIELQVTHSEATAKRAGGRIYSELSGPNILTCSRSEKPCLEQALHLECDWRKVARELCQQWLRESLYGKFCPVDPRLANITLDGHLDIGFAGNEFIEIPQRTKDNLRSYLFATLVDDPLQAARHLLLEMVPPRDGLDDAGEFHSKFRQAAYFGALEPVLGSDTNALAQLLFQHWKTALDHGYSPGPHLLCFYRGLFSIARAGRKLVPDADPLREGLEELDAHTTAEQFNEIAGVGYWLQNADKFAMAMINLPRAMDEALNRGVGYARDDSYVSPKSFSFGRRSFMSRGMLLVAAIIFIFHADGNTWTEKSAVLALMLVGLLGLRAWNE